MSILDRIVPSSALRWGRLTRERFDWWSDMVVFYGDHTAPAPPPLDGIRFRSNIIAIRMEPGYLAPYIDWGGPYTAINRAMWHAGYREGLDIDPEAFRGLAES